MRETALIVSTCCPTGCGMDVVLMHASQMGEFFAFCPGCGATWNANEARFDCGLNEVVSLRERAPHGATLVAESDLSVECGISFTPGVAQPDVLDELAELNARVMRSAPAARVAQTVWALCRRPALFTPSGAPAEVVSFLAGLMHYLPPPSGQQGLDSLGEFADWLRGKYGHPSGDRGTSEIMAALLPLAPAEQFPERLWAEFEQFADEVFDVAKSGTRHKLPGCSYTPQ